MFHDTIGDLTEGRELGHIDEWLPLHYCLGWPPLQEASKSRVDYWTTRNQFFQASARPRSKVNAPPCVPVTALRSRQGK